MNFSKIIHASLFTPTPDGWGQPLLLWGAAGTGKTKSIKQLVRRLGMAFERLSPAERGEGQFGVVPVPVDGVLQYPPPAWSANFNDGGLIFVDEISLAGPTLQPSLLGLVQLRVLGSHKFNERTRIIAAANETRDTVGGWDLSPPLLNRFGHLDYTGLDASAWAESLLAGFGDNDPTVINAQQEEERVVRLWPTALAAARGLVAGFIPRHPSLLHAQPKDPTVKAWPSRRSWEAATLALASASVHGLSDEETDVYVSAFIGSAAYGELSAFRAGMDLPDPQELLAGRATFVHTPERLDRTAIVLGACASLVVANKDEKQQKNQAIALWKLLDAVTADAADLAVPAMRALIFAGLVHARVDGASARPLTRLGPWTNAAGFTTA